MHLSILKINTQEMKGLLKAHVVHCDDSDLTSGRPSLATRRACSLALARHLLVKHGLLEIERANRTTIQHDESGAPYLAAPEEGRLKLQISISHSGPWSACLIAEGQKYIGLDLEDIHIQRNFLKLAEHYFSGEEIDYVRRCGGHAFYQLWTAKEAIAKLHGKGLSEALKIKLLPIKLDRGGMPFESPGYRLTQCATQDYIYTIAARDFGVSPSTEILSGIKSGHKRGLSGLS